MSRKTLINQLTVARRKFAGIGTRKVKLKLNRLFPNSLAKAFRLALEIEDCSILGKKYIGSEWSLKKFKQKADLIESLCRLCEINGWEYGKQPSNNGHTTYIIYFELPGCEQISFHTNLSIKVPNYRKEWDGKRNSTLFKLENAIENFLANENQCYFEIEE